MQDVTLDQVRTLREQNPLKDQCKTPFRICVHEGCALRTACQHNPRQDLFPYRLNEEEVTPITLEGLQVPEDLPEEPVRDELTLEIRTALQARHLHGNFAYFEELDVNLKRERRVDAFAMNLTSSQNFERTVYEIKVSVSDFRRERKNLSKTRQSLGLSNCFYYVTPKGLIKPDEIPIWAGLMEYDQGDLRIRVQAPYHESQMPTWAFVASLLQRSQKFEHLHPLYVRDLEAVLSALSGRYIYPDFSHQKALKRMVPALIDTGVVQRSEQHRSEAYLIKDHERLAHFVLHWARRRNFGITPEHHQRLMDED